MSDRPIQVGDLVMVVKAIPCCGTIGQWMGKIFTVVAFAPTWTCAKCKKTTFATAAMIDSHWRQPLVRLKRIPPLEELEGQRTEEKLKEPA